MAQHDYVIANGSGSAVRGDLNNALAAIVSNNSGTSEPSPTYAYQFWADTTTGLLKIRNGANNAWITLRELDGTLAIEAGTVSAPGLAFASDLNTGVWSPGADQFAIATNGVERVEWGTSEVVFNDGGADYDFRVEGDTKANLLLVDAGTDSVSIDGTTLQLANQTPLRLGDADNSHYVALRSPATVSTNVTWDLPAADGTADQSIVTDGSGALSFASRSRLVRATSVSASGIATAFTGIPSWVRRITVMFVGLSSNGTANVLVRIGDSGGIEGTGYVSTSNFLQGGSTSGSTNSTSGFVLVTGTATNVLSGQLIISNYDGNAWVATGMWDYSHTTGVTGMTAGYKGLSDTLDRIDIATANGTDTFDAGTLNIIYEG